MFQRQCIACQYRFTFCGQWLLTTDNAVLIYCCRLRTLPVILKYVIKQVVKLLELQGNILLLFFGTLYASFTVGTLGESQSIYFNYSLIRHFRNEKLKLCFLSYDLCKYVNIPYTSNN